MTFIRKLCTINLNEHIDINQFYKMNALEGKAKEAFFNFLDIWTSRNVNTIYEASLLVDDQSKGFGTGLNEYTRNKDDLMKQLKKEIHQIPDGLSFNITWQDYSQLGDELVGLSAQISFTFQLQKKTIEIENVRVTAMFRRVGNKMLVVQWHSSLPEATTNEDVFPGSSEPKRYEDVSVFFSDFIGFTNIVAKIPAKRLVEELNEIFENFDDIMLAEGVEKIQTTGDGYLAVCGLPKQEPDHAIKCILAGKKIIDYLKERNKNATIKWHARIGIHSGPVTTGILGKRKFTFNIFGDTVNVASRFETAGEKEKINVSAYTYNLIKDRFPCEYRGKIDVKGKGALDMYFVN